LQATLLRRRAALHAAQQSAALALADASAALSINPSDVDALVLRAQLHRAAGEAERCFLDLRAVHLLAPQARLVLHRFILHRGAV
jgi:hypothetical protein